MFCYHLIVQYPISTPATHTLEQTETILLPFCNHKAAFNIHDLYRRILFTDAKIKYPIKLVLKMKLLSYCHISSFPLL